ncbi:MAG: hypothetical protein P8P15_03735 [Polaribacter sp.]|nr:hypothetical protein [Polaribacter sp.]
MTYKLTIHGTFERLKKKSKTTQKVTLKQADEILVIEWSNIEERGTHD